MINKKEIESMFDSLADNCKEGDEMSSGVIMALFSEKDEIGFHAAHGNAAVITALLTAIIESTAEKLDATPQELLDAIALAIESAED